MSEEFPRLLRAEFVKSAPNLASCPEPLGPEVAVAGRSNVGKSSLLNLLCGRRRLAQVSSTPGRTRLLNFFRVYFSSDISLTLVDLPGYGFARLSAEARRAFGPMVEGYLLGRKPLLVLLVDIRRDPEEEEQQLAEFARVQGLPFLVLATKADEVPKSKKKLRLQAIRAALGLGRLPVATSAKAGEGRDEAWRAILKALGLLAKSEEKESSS